MVFGRVANGLSLFRLVMAPVMREESLKPVAAFGTRLRQRMCTMR
jgi:hypothetical protein